ncbi:Serine/threonine-protein kinase [Coemansia sp. RSA 1365]|nr:Serine/threonine-protein kinase [Coemansia sp. RSA 1365]
MLESRSSDLDTRLAFTLNLDTLNEQKRSITSKQSINNTDLIQSRVRRNTFKKLISSRRRVSNVSRRRQNNTNQYNEQSSNNESELETDRNSRQFHLQQLHLPSPIASFCPDLWSNHNSTEENNNILSSPVPIAASISDNDNVILTEHVPQQISQNNVDTQRNTTETIDMQHQPVCPKTPPTMQGAPMSQISASSDQVQNNISDINNREIQNAEQPPRRGRSLMFKPLLDVSAVGTLIDTISNVDMPQPTHIPNQRKISLQADISNKAKSINSVTPPGRKILGSLRRATAITRVGRKRSKTGRVLRQQSQHVKGIFHRNGPGVARLNTRPRSHEIRPIETIQGDDDDATTGVVLLPPPPKHIRRAGTVNITTRAPRTSLSRQKSLRQQKVIPVEDAEPVNPNSIEPAKSASADPAELIPANSDKSTALETDTIRIPQPGFQAATAVMAAAATSARSNQNNITQAEEEILPGYTPIAVSLKSPRSRQFLLNTPLGEFQVEKTIGQGSYVREANLALILGQIHPHIVELHDFRVTDTHFYLFYAYVCGTTLAERVGHGGLEENDARSVFKAVAETIHFCHQYSVIHRDIKLENVLIDSSDDHINWQQQQSSSSGGVQPRGLWTNRSSSTSVGVSQSNRQESALDGRVKLIDFGLANFFDGHSLMDTFCGSLPYTAPEILRGDAYVGPEVDVWSLGVLLYVMVTGHFPFEDPAQPRNYDRIMAGDFSLYGSMSRPLQELLVRMLEPSPQRRISMLDVLQNVWLVSHPSPPGVCCAVHAPAAPVGIHTRRTLALPGPRASRLAAREAALCLGRSVDDVVRAIDNALAAGTLVTHKHSSNSITAPWNLLASVHQWPGSRDPPASELREVANSPYVSVYALVLQQIAMRRYYLDLPAAEASAVSSACVSSASSHQLLRRPLPRSVPATDSRGLRGLLPQEFQPQNSVEPYESVAFVSDAENPHSVPDAASLEAESLPRTLLSRLAAQLGSITSLASGLFGGDTSNRRVITKSNIRRDIVHESLVPPAYTQPLSTGEENRRGQQSMPVLPQKHSTRRPLFSGARRRQKQQSMHNHKADVSDVPTVRCIGALENINERILLPVELSSASAVRVLGLLSSLLDTHQIAHTFVEKQQVPMQRALDSSMFSLKTIATIMSRAVHQRESNNPQPNSLQNNSIFTDAFTSQEMFGISEDCCDPSTSLSNHENNGLRARLHKALVQPSQRLSQKIPQHIRSLKTKAPTQTIRELPPIHHTSQNNLPSLVADVPVKYATSVILAQYSPSLNRWRETEVVEYYSCAVRLELVRIAPVQLRTRYALLLTRMTGHRGKFDLFRAFLCRIVSALPTLTPAALPIIRDNTVDYAHPLNQTTLV